MARIELRDSTIYLLDGLSGTATISTASPTATDTNVNINTVNLNTTYTEKVPVGARFTVNTANNVTVYTVTDRTLNGNTVNAIVFSPAWGANTPSANDVITFQSQRLEINIGAGNITWTEARSYEYVLDRGNLDTVRQQDEVPLDISIDAVYDYITTETGQTITPVDALKGIGGAAEWVTSSADPCEPYCVDIEVMHCLPCGTVEDEDLVFANFRYESLKFDIKAATIAVTGKCNVSEATATRANYTDCA
jgi:hypothetical protein